MAGNTADIVVRLLKLSKKQLFRHSSNLVRMVVKLELGARPALKRAQFPLLTDDHQRRTLAVVVVAARKEEYALVFFLQAGHRPV